MNILATVSEGCHFGSRGVWRWDKAGTSCFWDTQFMASLPKLLSTQVRKINIFWRDSHQNSPKGLTVAKIIIICGLFTFAFATGGAIHISNHNRGRFFLELLAQLVPILMEKNTHKLQHSWTDSAKKKKTLELYLMELEGLTTFKVEALWWSVLLHYLYHLISFA